MRETRTQTREGGSPHALPLVGCESREEARRLITAIGRLAYNGRDYLCSLESFDGSVEGIFTAQKEAETILDRWRNP